MPPENKSNLRREERGESADIEGLLAQIEGEQIPERLLTLAQELQHALNIRKKQLSLNAK